MSKKFFHLRLCKFATILVMCLSQTCLSNAQEVSEGGVALFEKFKGAIKKQLCGGREDVFYFGNQIVKEYADDPQNQDVVFWVKKKIAETKEAERICARNNTYDQLYRDKFWQPFLAVSKQIIDEEGDTPLALDVTLTAVSVGFSRVQTGEDTYLPETLAYANQAITRFEFGQKSKTGRFGVFEPFNTRANALGWLNYIIGWLDFQKLNKKQEPIAYFHEALRHTSEVHKYCYYILGEIYSDESYRTTGEKQKGYADRALIAYSHAYSLELIPSRKEEIYKKIETVYRNRFGLSIDEETSGLAELVPQLMITALPSPSEAVTPVFDDRFLSKNGHEQRL